LQGIFTVDSLLLKLILLQCPASIPGSSDLVYRTLLITFTSKNLSPILSPDLSEFPAFKYSHVFDKKIKLKGKGSRLPAAKLSLQAGVENRGYRSIL
jgi:hypothetical protein